MGNPGRIPPPARTAALAPDVRRLSSNVFNDFNPGLMPDGRILYTRWEYNERSVTAVHNPFTMHPDGSMVATYFGNATIVPNVYMYPRPVPGSGKIMALFTNHHGQTHGAVGLIDVRQGVDGPQAIRVLTPEVPMREHGRSSRNSRGPICCRSVARRPSGRN